MTSSGTPGHGGMRPIATPPDRDVSNGVCVGGNETNPPEHRGRPISGISPSMGFSEMGATGGKGAKKLVKTDRPRVEILVGGNATASTHANQGGLARETAPIGRAWGSRHVMDGIDSIDAEPHKYRNEWEMDEGLSEPDGAPRRNSLHRTSRTRQGAAIVWGATPASNINHPMVPRIRS